MKKMLMVLAAVSMSLVVFADEIVTSVTARQVEPWKVVEITVGLTCASNELNEVCCTFAATNSATRAALPVTKIRQVGNDTGSGTSWTRHFIWDAAADLGEVKIDDVALSADTFRGVQLWENGPYWATCNVGASKPEESGYYFWWGDTVGYKRNAANNGWVSVEDGTTFRFDSSYCPSYDKDISQQKTDEYIDATGNLLAEHDAATAHLGAPWRMPTHAEFSTLISNCTTTWTMHNGVSGRLVSGKGNYAAKNIFIPAVGYGVGYRIGDLDWSGIYWSSTPDSILSNKAWSLYFSSSDFANYMIIANYYGQPVRPLREFAQLGGVSSYAVTVHFAVDCSHCGQVTRLLDAGSTLTVDYSPDFADSNDSATVRVLMNGVVLVESSGSGAKTITFGESGLYQFSHQVLVNGVVAETMVASYAVAPQGHVVVPDTWTEIPDGCFKNCDWLSSIVIPSSVTNIASTAFVGCNNITNVILHGGITAPRQIVTELVDGTKWGVEEEQLDGDTVFKSNVIIPYQSTAIEFDIHEGLKILVFSWKVGSQSNCDWLTWYLDGVQKGRISGSQDWAIVSNALDGAAHRVKFVYSKDGFVSTSPDCGWVSIRGLSKRPDVLKKTFPDSPVMTVSINDDVAELPDGFFAGCTTLESVSLPDALVTIGRDTFKGCSSLATIAIPSGVTNIGADAFLGCENLTHVDVASLEDWLKIEFANATANPLSTGAKLFVGGGEETNLVIPNGTTRIGAYAFAGAAFTSVTIPSSVTSIGTGAFSGCANITSVSVPASVNVASVFADSKTKIARVTFMGTGTVPASAYSGCTALTRVEVASLEDWLSLSFANATSNPLSTGARLYVNGTELTNLVVPDGMTRIGKYALAGTVLTSVSIPVSVKNVGTGAFSACNALTHVEIASLEAWMALSFADAAANPLSTGAKLYVGGTEVSNLVIPNATMRIGDYAFAGVPFASVTIPPGMTSVGVGAFSGCKNITSVSVPASVDVASVFVDSKTKIASVTITETGTVPASAYSGCTALMRVEVASLADWMALSFANAAANPLSTGAKLYVDGTEVTDLIVTEGTTEIGAYAFAGGSFSSVTIPNSVTHIAATAFAGCKNITSVSVPASVNVASVFEDSKAKIARVTITGTGKVPASAYSGCMALKRIEVASLADWMALSFSNATANPLSSGARLFVGGTELTNLVIPSGTTHIGNYAFAGATITSVTIPASVTSIAATAFTEWPNISFVVPADMNVATVFADSKHKLTRVTITGTGTVPASAYSGCTALSRVDVASLADWMALSLANAEANPLSTGAKLYVSGTELTNLVIPDGTTCIGKYAFANAEFTSVTIPSSVTNIAATAFSGCSNIVDVTMGCGTMMSLDRPQFEGDWIELGDNQYKSRAIGGSQSSSLSTIVEVGCERIVKFRWSVSSESGCDYLRVFVDDVKKDEISGSRDWKEVSLNLAMGRHVIRWTYSKDGSLASGADCGWVDVSELVVPCASTLAEIFPNSYAHIRTLTLLDGVTRLPSDLLTGCIALTLVTMPTSISSVGAGAFSDCTALTRVEVASIEDWLALSFANAEANPLSTGAKLYVDGTELTGLIVTEGTTKIGAYAFAGGMFSSITIPLSVTDIAATAFSGCTNITSVSVPASLNVASVFSDSKTKITSVAIAGTGTVPASAYSGCTALTRVEVASLADWLSLSFANAAANPLSTGAKLYVDGTEVTGLIIPEGTTEIGAYAFAGGAFSSVSIPNSVTNVEATAFAGCKNITSVAVPASMSVATVFGDSKTNIARVTITGTGTVPASAYSGCTALTHVEVASLEDWLALSFANAAANPLSTGAKLYVGGSEVTNLVIPSGTTSIGNYAFAGAAFTSVTIPPSVTNIAETAFAGCKNIESVYVPSWMKVSELFASSLGVLREAVLVNVGGQIVESAFAGCRALREIVVPEGTTSIAANAFKDCASLERVSLPVSLKTIGVNAFAGCTAIVAVTCPALGRLAEIFPASYSKIADVTIAPGPARLPDGMFAGCTALRRLELSDGITVVGPGAFVGCSGLRNLVLPDSVSRFEIGAFDECPTLELITPPAGLVDFRLADIPLAARKSWGLEYDADGFIVWNGILVDYAYKDASEIVIPEEVVVIGGEALAGMADLESVVWPSALKRIGMGAFASDTYLDNLAIPDTVETICEDAFADCSYLQTLTMGRGVKTVLDRAFKGCTQLAAVRFHPELVSIGSEAFGGCWRMKSVGLPLSVAAVAEDAFTGCDKLEGLTMPTHRAPLSSWFKPVYRQIAAVTVPVGETDVIADMFDGCSALVELELPEGVTNIGSRACRDCLKLVSLTVPSTVVEIGEEAFRGCEMLEAIVLQSGVERIGAAAFRDCLRLKDVTLSESLTVLPEHLFAGCRALDSLTVPKGVSSLGADFVSSWTTEVYYLGDAPAFDENAYRGADWALTSYVINGTKGWDGRPTSRDLPESWPVGNGYARSIKTWTTVRYDVTFNAGSGIFAPVSSNAYACEESVGSVYAIPPYEPRLAGMKFDGWWTEPEAGSRITANTLVVLQKTHTLYAHWKSVPTIRVRFNACGGTVMPGEDSYEVGEPFGYFPEPTREHYAFAGWYDRAEGGREVLVSHEVPGANVELFAHWTPCLYILQLHANNGTAAACDQLFTYGETVTILDYETLRSRHGFAEPQGCTFAGWAVSPGGAAVYADAKTLAEVGDIEDGVIHLWACWSSGRYSVRFDSHGGTGRMDDQTFQIGVPQALIKNRYVRDGFLFGGWALTTDSDAAYADGDVVKDLTTVKDATVSLYAVWVRQSGTSIVTFELNGGTLEPSHAERTSGAAFGTLPVPTRTGYTFARWTLRDGTTVTASSIVPQTDVTLYAVWLPIGYSIVFDANGGTGTIDAINCVYGQEYELPARGFAWEGHVFKGWSTDANGEVEHEPGAIVKNLTGSDNGVIRLYAVWEPERPVAPVITPAGGTVFMSDSCMVSISCATEGAIIYCSTTAVPRPTAGNVYSAPFAITETTTVYAFAVRGGRQSATVSATITKRRMSLAESVGAPELTVATGGAAAWCPVADESVDEDGVSARSGQMEAAAAAGGNESWMEVSVNGAGTLAFWWRVDCEDDGPGTVTWDRLMYLVDGVEQERIDGWTDWERRTVEFSTPGEHKVRWTYHKDDYDDPLFPGEDCGWIDRVSWTPSATPEPSIAGDAGATVTGDAEKGFVVTPSKGKTEIEVTIPAGFDAAKVTVEVAVTVERVKPNGAKVKVVSGGADITEFLDLPAADKSDTVDLSQATVKAEIVKEALDPKQGAEIKLDPANPTLTTANTRKGLTYTLYEGEALEGMKAGDSTLGDGQPWTPRIEVKGGASAFYTIGVGK